MSISSHQIQNIIQTYSRQLRARVAGRDETGAEKAEPLANDVVDISSEGRRHVLLERTGTEAVKNLKNQALESLKG
jgi:acetylornithine/succinyldiaminopimelate/putrescine aminotransferase